DKRADELILANQEKEKRADELVLANKELAYQNQEKDKRADELILANQEKEKRADELVLANKELAYQNQEKDKRADELSLAKVEKNKRADELVIANIEKNQRADELIRAKEELAFQNREKDKRADELILANLEKDKRADELILANLEKDKRADVLIAAHEAEDKRADALIIAHALKEKIADELILANLEKDKRADELILANQEKDKLADELITTYEEEDKRIEELRGVYRMEDQRADELILANEEKKERADELSLANEEKKERADELSLANEEKKERADELIIANQEKQKRADELIIANQEKQKRADELIIANQEKQKRADELIIANQEKQKRADELIIANIEKRKRARELDQANKELAFEKELDGYRSEMERVAKDLTLLVDTANAPIFGIDSHGNVNEWNQQAEISTGYSKTEVMGQDLVANFIAEEHRSSVGNILEKALKGEQTANYEFVLFSKAGNRIDILLNSTTRRDATGKIVGVVGVGQDITELNRVRKAQELIQQASDKTKSEFISTISHELRTPLTSIKGALSLIKAGVVDKSHEKFLLIVNMAYKNSARLHQLIDEILDIEKLDSGKIKMQMSVMDLSVLLDEAATTNRGFAEEYDVTFVRSGIEQPLFVRGDHDRLMQVMGNLLSNAAKFSRIGGKVEISLARHNGNLRIAVKDYGCGIVEESRATIFEKFTQADSSDVRQQGGSGLGLSIAKKLIEQHNGHIDFTSVVDKGTTFYVDLPEI
ncbi:MAG: PAS domain S-box-containing protein, partial [Arenicella sp.]